MEKDPAQHTRNQRSGPEDLIPSATQRVSRANLPNITEGLGFKV